MSKGAPAESGRLPEKGLGLALEILEQVARDDQGMSAAQIARAIGAPRASIYRLINSLVKDEYLVRRADFSGFLLGTRVLELAAVVDAHRRPLYLPVLQALRATTHEAVHLIGFHAGGVQILDEDLTAPISDRLTLLSDPTRSAIGHLWLIEPPTRPAPAASLAWSVRVDRDLVAAIASTVSTRGYAQQHGMLNPERGCVAVPIREGGVSVGALSLSTSVDRLSLAVPHLEALRDAADSLAGLSAFASL